VNLRQRKIARLLSTLSLICLSAVAPARDKDAAAKTVDQGSFGVFMNSRRVATETFSIQQSAAGSVVTSLFKSEQGAEKAEQSSTLQLSPTGEIKRYEWKELSPGKTQAVVTPGDSFLSERIVTNPQDKPTEQPFLLPSSTSILDDYFFVDREVLLWKYLAITCRQEAGGVKCPERQRTKFGTINPHARNSTPVDLEFSGKEKGLVHGAEVDLFRFTLKSESGDWSLWVDGGLKLVRILIAGENTEVIRD
jgi:hypothetical protein